MTAAFAVRSDFPRQHGAVFSTDRGVDPSRRAGRGDLHRWRGIPFATGRAPAASEPRQFGGDRRAWPRTSDPLVLRSSRFDRAKEMVFRLAGIHSATISRLPSVSPWWPGPGWTAIPGGFVHNEQMGRPRKAGEVVPVTGSNLRGGILGQNRWTVAPRCRESVEGKDSDHPAGRSRVPAHFSAPARKSQSP